MDLRVISSIFLLVAITTTSVNSKNINPLFSKLWPSSIDYQNGDIDDGDGGRQKSLRPLWMVTSTIPFLSNQDTQRFEHNDNNVANIPMGLVNQVNQDDGEHLSRWPIFKKEDNGERNVGNSFMNINRQRNSIAKKKSLLPPMFNYLQKIKGTFRDEKQSSRKHHHSNNVDFDDFPYFILKSRDFNVHQNDAVAFDSNYNNNKDENTYSRVPVKRLYGVDTEVRFPAKRLFVDEGTRNRLTRMLQKYTSSLLNERFREGGNINPKEVEGPGNSSSGGNTSSGIASEEDGIWG